MVSGAVVVFNRRVVISLYEQYDFIVPSGIDLNREPHCDPHPVYLQQVFSSEPVRSIMWICFRSVEHLLHCDAFEKCRK